MQYNGLIQAPKAKNLSLRKISKSLVYWSLNKDKTNISMILQYEGIVTSNKATFQEEIQHYMNLKLLLK